MRDALIVAGPTCSGKSALAIALAQRLGGVVINADSMQVYRELRIVTARPSEADEAQVAHRLYGVRPAAEAGSVAWWRHAALAEMEATEGLPILCGGTGLYFTALTQGIADIPEPTPEARQEARGLLDEIGVAALHARLAAVDPTTAAGLRPTEASASPAPGKSGAAPGRGWRPGKPTNHRRRPGASPKSCSTRRAKRCAPASPPAFRPCSPKACSTRSAPCWR